MILKILDPHKGNKSTWTGNYMGKYFKFFSYYLNIIQR